ncbi:MAG: 5-methyltetrahydrofolate--homocysteine methyltransferase, partial [Proteobacteria bacterium]|nr:5-methyltetrahydrofolate--homocysteine methyltransferase [Pseudomonadota bacterium]
IKKTYPGVEVSIGVGNLTNGLAKKPYMRKVLTSVFLDEARKEGMDAAIINPNHYVPVVSLDPKDYDLGRRIVLERDMDAFSELEEIAELKKGGSQKKKVSYDDLPIIEAICLKIKEGFKEREEGEVHFDGSEYPYHDRIVLQVVKILETMKPLELINEHLMVAMEELGDGFAEGTVSLPHLLKSADVMKQVMGFLESYIKKSSGEDQIANTRKGTIILGTVYQDVHSIGKDLTKTLLENYGFHIIDLGVQVPLQKFIDVAKENNADAIGVSALLVQTSNHMITLSGMMKEQGLSHLPLLIGGAPVTMRHAAFVAMAGEDSTDNVRDNVFYCNSAMTGVNVLTQLIDKSRRLITLEGNRKKLEDAYTKGVQRQAKQKELLNSLPRRVVTFENKHPQVDQCSRPQRITYGMKDFRPYIDEKQLFALNWKFGGKGGWQKKGTNQEDLRKILDEWINKTDSKGWLQPQGMIGLFPCRSLKNGEVELYDPESGNPAGVFVFNDIIGQGKKDLVNMSQYFSAESMDVIGLQLTSAGPDVQEIIKKLRDDQGDQESAWFLQGLAARVAEDMATKVNETLEKMVWGAGGGISTRYSPGYPAMSDLKNNQVCADLLNAVPELGISLTGSYEFSPTGTTAAVVCFHPDSGYR